ncbi:hypothetical protein niasHT_016197 [Heterodera trifolii]|uniref:Fibronectin type-III domain-containing protein n=1 Tax=Heterodera trifolii TaxID=157864 RepID=A0ABD2KTU8_9BILA
MVPKCLPLELLYEIVPFIPAENAVPNALSSCRLLHKLLLPRVIKWQENMATKEEMVTKIDELKKEIMKKFERADQRFDQQQKQINNISTKVDDVSDQVMTLTDAVIKLADIVGGGKDEGGGAKNIRKRERDESEGFPESELLGTKAKVQCQENVASTSLQAGKVSTGAKSSLMKDLAALKLTLSREKLKGQEASSGTYPVNEPVVWTECTQSQIEVKWKAANEQGRQIESYIVERMDKWGRWTVVKQLPHVSGKVEYSFNFKLPSMSPDIEYSFHVITVFAGGHMETSETFTGRLDMKCK